MEKTYGLVYYVIAQVQSGLLAQYTILTRFSSNYRFTLLLDYLSDISNNRAIEIFQNVSPCSFTKSDFDNNNCNCNTNSFILIHGQILWYCHCFNARSNSLKLALFSLLKKIRRLSARLVMAVRSRKWLW